jgi:orotate phosphoribosyltransferase
MSAKDALKDEILKKAVVHGKVILSSGKEADYYVDLRRVTLDATAAPLVGEVMLELTKDLSFEAVGGLTLGPDVKGRRVLAVEDTSTTGGSVLTAVEALKEAGAIVVAVAVIVERGAAGKVKEAGFEYRAAYQLADLGL